MSRLAATALAAAAVVVAAAAAGAEVRLEWWAGANPGEGAVHVVGLDSTTLSRLPQSLDAALGRRLLRVVARPAEAATRDELPNLWGAWRVESGNLVFRPRHALAASMALEARFDGNEYAAATGAAPPPSLELRQLIAATPGAPPTVVRVSPSAATVPANLLRLYVEFSRPMSARDVERHVTLSAEGRAVDLAFVDVRNGLWDAERRRLTLFVHPGRVKTGVAVNETLGPVLREGAEIVVTVGAGARDADGRTLERPFEHRWRVAPARREELDPAQWKLGAPTTPRGELTLSFPFPLDRGLLARAFAVLADHGTVDGTWTVGEEERSVHFAPDTAWVPGLTYRVAIDPVLEDPTGQRIGRAFERPADGSGTATATAATPISLQFTAAF